MLHGFNQRRQTLKIEEVSWADLLTSCSLAFMWHCAPSIPNAKKKYTLGALPRWSNKTLVNLAASPSGIKSSRMPQPWDSKNLATVTKPFKHFALGIGVCIRAALATPLLFSENLRGRTTAAPTR